MKEVHEKETAIVTNHKWYYQFASMRLKASKSNNIKYGIELQKVDKVTESMICDLYLDGYGTMDICRKLNKDKGTVRKILIKNNIKLRTKQETNKLRRNLLTSKKMPHESLTLNKDN